MLDLSYLAPAPRPGKRPKLCRVFEEPESRCRCIAGKLAARGRLSAALWRLQVQQNRRVITVLARQVSSRLVQPSLSHCRGRERVANRENFPANLGEYP